MQSLAEEEIDMARRPNPPQQPASLHMNADQMRRGVVRIQKRLELVKAFDPESVDERDVEKSTRPLQTTIQTALTETFGEDTSEYRRFSSAMYFHYPINMFERTPRHRIVEAMIINKQNSIDLLMSAISLLEERLEETNDTSAAVAAAVNSELSRKVFVVHGHDEGPREAVARFLQQLGLTPVILHDQPNRGRTIISKFSEEASDVGFAVVLITPDDAPGTANGLNRARQNVIFELGFFLGKLGPSHVAAIVKDHVETPSDYDGIIYIPYADWKLPLARELKAAGYSIDLNKAFQF